GKFVLQEGTLYPILYRLVDQGLVESERVMVGRRMSRVYYQIPPRGQNTWPKSARSTRTSPPGWRHSWTIAPRSRSKAQRVEKYFRPAVRILKLSKKFQNPV